MKYNPVFKGLMPAQIKCIKFYNICLLYSLNFIEDIYLIFRLTEILILELKYNIQNQIEISYNKVSNNMSFILIIMTFFMTKILA